MNKEIQEYLNQKLDAFPDDIYGEGSRCSVYLKDGTFLPCVIFRDSKKTVELALKRFDDEKKGKGIFKKENSIAYKSIVKHFLTSGKRVNSYDVAKVEQSRYAFPLSILRDLRGETTMSWTAFVLEMNDGKLFQFGTSFLVEFFDLPDNYCFSDVSKIHNHSFVNSKGELGSLKEGGYGASRRL